MLSIMSTSIIKLNFCHTLTDTLSLNYVLNILLLDFSEHENHFCILVKFYQVFSAIYFSPLVKINICKATTKTTVSDNTINKFHIADKGTK